MFTLIALFHFFKSEIAQSGDLTNPLFSYCVKNFQGRADSQVQLSDIQKIRRALTNLHRGDLAFNDLEARVLSFLKEHPKSVYSFSETGSGQELSRAFLNAERKIGSQRVIHVNSPYARSASDDRFGVSVNFEDDSTLSVDRIKSQLRVTEKAIELRNHDSRFSQHDHDSVIFSASSIRDIEVGISWLGVKIIRKDGKQISILLKVFLPKMDSQYQKLLIASLLIKMVEKLYDLNQNPFSNPSLNLNELKDKILAQLRMEFEKLNAFVIEQGFAVNSEELVTFQINDNALFRYQNQLDRVAPIKFSGVPKGLRGKDVNKAPPSAQETIEKIVEWINQKAGYRQIIIELTKPLGLSQLLSSQTFIPIFSSDFYLSWDMWIKSLNFKKDTNGLLLRAANHVEMATSVFDILGHLNDYFNPPENSKNFIATLVIGDSTGARFFLVLTTKDGFSLQYEGNLEIDWTNQQSIENAQKQILIKQIELMSKIDCQSDANINSKCI